MQSSPGVARSAARRSLLATLSLAALAILGVALIAAPSASAKKIIQGGLSSSTLETEIPESTEPEAPVEAETTEGETGPISKARLVGTRAIAPTDAPTAVKQVIAAANRIRTTPYIWGGGHGRWQDRGYDCSGAVSYALHGARLLSTPLTSGSLESWGEAGPGRWITVYANAGHAYMVVAGLRFDTAGNVSGTGPRWHPTVAAAAPGRYVVRHPAGF
ncbi:MAG: C40 family peptidase [Actinobacteria bacterium]|nr:C40 family peptidase [Actinomycetota bacterium]